MPATNGVEPAFSTRIDLPEKGLLPVIQLLNECLADTADLYSQIKHAHWSVKGLNLFQLHELFDQLAGEVLPESNRIGRLGDGNRAHGSIEIHLARVPG